MEVPSRLGDSVEGRGRVKEFIAEHHLRKEDQEVLWQARKKGRKNVAQGLGKTGGVGKGRQRMDKVTAGEPRVQVGQPGGRAGTVNG